MGAIATVQKVSRWAIECHAIDELHLQFLAGYRWDVGEFVVAKEDSAMPDPAKHDLEGLGNVSSIHICF